MNKIQVLCHKCRNKFPKEELTFVSKTKRYCKDCIKDKEDYAGLIDYMCKGFNIKAPTGQQLKDIKQFKEQGYSYFEIQYCIYYIFGILGRKPKGTSLGLIPFYIESSREHYKSVMSIKNSLDVEKLKEEIVEVQTNIDLRPNIKNTRLVNIEDLI